MKIKPVEAISAPKYPDKYQEEVRPMLIAAKPHRWRGVPLAAGLSAVVALSLSGCHPDLATMGVPVLSPTVPIVTPGNSDLYITAGEPVPFLAIPHDLAIPLFEYGDGTGAIGCVSISAPVFLSEEEAFAILFAVFADAGLMLTKGTEKLENTNLPVTNIYDFDNEGHATVQKDIVPDGLLEGILPIMFVSRNDLENWHKDNGRASTVSVYNTKKAAEALSERTL